MPPLEISFAGYQKPESIHTRSAAYFGEALTAELGDGVGFTLIPSVTDLGHRQGDMIRLVGEANSISAISPPVSSPTVSCPPSGPSTCPSSSMASITAIG